VRYHDLMRDFLKEEGNKEFADKFPKFHITLICDQIGLTGATRAAFDGYKSTQALTHINWKTFLLRTGQAHQEFLNEAKRQRKLSGGKS